MSEKQNERENEKEEQFLYRWDYDGQVAYESGKDKKKRRGGAFGYILITVVSFLVVFGILGAAVLESGWGKSGGVTGEPAVAVAERVNPSVVLVYASSSVGAGSGTGFFIRSDGYIATNYHLIAGQSRISVTLYNGDVLEATVVGGSEIDDLAVLKIEGKGYPAVSVGDSSALKSGQTVIAIGNPGGSDFAWTVSQGIVSYPERRITISETNASIGDALMIQIDVAVNPGNSGGPLCNADGEVVGIVTRKKTDYEGVGFAIPINGAMKLLDAIVKNGNVNGVKSEITHIRPTIGIMASAIKTGDPYTYMGVEYSAVGTGIFVSSVTSGGPSDGKLKVCDIITSINGKSVTTMDEVFAILYQYDVGDTVTLRVLRDGEPVDVKVKLGTPLD